MLSGTQFYYRTIRKSVVAFGTLFKDIYLVKYANDPNNINSQTEISRIKVPLQYAGKEDFWTRISSGQGGENLPHPIEIKLPQMSFHMVNINYDANRKLQTGLQQLQLSTTNPNGVTTGFVGVPYNIDFELNLFARNMEDGLQIIEQILPWFTPDYTLAYFDPNNNSQQLPITLTGVNWSNEYEGGAPEQIRRITWTLTFTMQQMFYGPKTGGGLITQANTNINYYANLPGGDLALELPLANTGFLSYQVGELVYQGSSIPEANAVGTVEAFAGNTLFVTMVQGSFVPGINAIGALTSASWNVVSVPLEVPLATITITPNPPNATANEDFGFTTTIVETPATLPG